MPSKKYRRRDIELSVQREGDSYVARAGENDFFQWDARSDRFPLIRRRQTAKLISRRRSEDDFTIDRLVLRITGEAAQARDWESLLRESFGDRFSIVRVSPVPPRVRRIGLTFPLRFLELGGTATIEEALDDVFNHHRRDDAVLSAHAPLVEARGFLERAQWATAEVLHLHELPEGDGVTRTSRGEVPGTAGWLLRVATQWQTRLIVLEADADELPYARRAAQRIADRGGPAVLVLDRAHSPVFPLYASIVHDRPLDYIQRGIGAALFAGAGREELLRYSGIGEKVAKLSAAAGTVDETPPPRSRKRIVRTSEVAGAVETALDSLSIHHEGAVVPRQWSEDAKCYRADDLICAWFMGRNLAVEPQEAIFFGLREHGTKIQDIAAAYLETARPLDVNAAKTALNVQSNKMRRMLPALAFEDHESEGMLPMAAKVANIRALHFAARRFPQIAFSVETVPKAVNAHFYEDDENGSLEKIPQATARLMPGATVILGVKIGMRIMDLITFDAPDFLEEKIEWDAEQNGAWIEIGVTGIDFDVIGDPVQEVWLPRGDGDGMRDIAAFVVRPRLETTVPGAARLRISIFHKNNLVQSFLMAALLKVAKSDAPLAKALGVPLAKLRERGKAGYMMRGEYNTVEGIDDAVAVERRALTIIANESAGEKVVTFKGDEIFGNTRSKNLPDKVKAARDALLKSSITIDKDYPYQFGQPNAGDPAKLLKSLWEIGLAGWDLFNVLEPNGPRQQAVRKSLAEGGGIHAAHIDLGNVVPWSLIYDRPISTNATYYENPGEDDEKTYTVERALCPAGLRAPDASLPCEVDADCPLRPSSVSAMKNAGGPIVRPESVICARRFWGFTQPIEVPVQQIDPKSDTQPPGLKKTIVARKPAEVIAGFNVHLPKAGEHRKTLESRLSTAVVKLRTPKKPDRDAIQAYLGRKTPAIVYLYCHAYTEAVEGSNRIGPNLNFGAKPTIADGLIASEITGDPWELHPLVFLNGCSTVGFSPAAPSQFITQFIQGREAAAVIGTEVTVWELLAGEVACEFLSEFLSGKAAGEALLLARRRLLAKSNPLGLVYTLYGNANLSIQWS